MHYTDYDTRLAAYAVIVDDDRLLLTWFNGGTSGREEPGWSLPGGGVEYDETPAQGVVRETREETGHDVEVGALLAVDTFTAERRDRPFKGVRLLYAATITGGTLGTLEVGGTTDFAQWVTLDELAADGRNRAGIVDLAVELARARQ